MRGLTNGVRALKLVSLAFFIALLINIYQAYVIMDSGVTETHHKHEIRLLRSQKEDLFNLLESSFQYVSRSEFERFVNDVESGSFNGFVKKIDGGVRVSGLALRYSGDKIVIERD